jgi:hypothetical protein
LENIVFEHVENMGEEEDEDMGEEYPLIFQTPPPTLPCDATKRSIFREIVDSFSPDRQDRCVPEYLMPQPPACITTRGGFPIVKQDILSPKYKRWREFPPPPGEAYEPDLGKKPVRVPEVHPEIFCEFQRACKSTDGNNSGGQSRTSSPNCSDTDSPTKVTTSSEEAEEKDEDLHIGEKVAESIIFNRKTTLDYTPGVSGRIMSTAEMREDFIVSLRFHTPASSYLAFSRPEDVWLTSGRQISTLGRLLNTASNASKSISLPAHQLHCKIETLVSLNYQSTYTISIPGKVFLANQIF